MKRAAILIIDGLGDLPHPELAGRTPLEAARTPNMDYMATTGSLGLVDPVAPGVVPNTDSGTALLMGLPMAEVSRLRRGAIEAAGVGRSLRPGEIALRANFASVVGSQGQLMVVDRRAGRIRHGLEQLARELNGTDLGNGFTAELVSTEQHRGVLILAGGQLEPSISDTDPGDTVLPAPLPWSRALAPRAEGSAAALNRFIRHSHDVLSNHPVNVERARAGKKPANIVITRGAGSAIGVSNQVSRQGIHAAVISGCNTVRGLGRLLGFDLFDDDAFTAGLDTDLDGKVRAAISALDTHDVAYIQIKAADICAHDRKPLQKQAFIERIDTAIGPLLEQDIVVAVTADHTTDSNSGYHTSDPVPALIFDSSAVPGQSVAVKFGESACRNGNLPRQNAEQFLRRVLAGVSGM